MAERLLSVAVGAGGATRRLASRAVAGGRRLVRGVCEACCGPSADGVQFYIRVCRCYDPADVADGEEAPAGGSVALCAAPVQRCLYLPLRGDVGDDYEASWITLTDRPGVRLVDRLGELLALGAAGRGVTIDPGLAWTSGLEETWLHGCYRITGGLYTAPGVSAAARAAFIAEHGLGDEWMPLDLPEPGPIDVGGNVPHYGAAAELRATGGCGHGHGCGRWEVAGPFYEAFRCAGGGSDGRRLLVCAGNAGLVVRGPVEWDGLEGNACWCINRSARFELAEVEALVAAGDGLVVASTSLDFVRWWRFDAQGLFSCVPAPCCWCLAQGGGGGGGGSGDGPCLRGKVYQKMPDEGGGPSTLWAVFDTCCGTRSGNRLRIELESSWVRTFTDPLGRAVTYGQAVVGTPRYSDDPDGDGRGGTLVAVDVRSYTTVDGALVYDAVSEYLVRLPAACVLFGNPDRQAPWPGAFAPHSSVGGGPGGEFGAAGCSEQGWLEYSGNFDDAEQVVAGVQLSPWAFIFRPAVPAGGGIVEQTGSFASDRPGRATVRVSQHLEDGADGVTDARFVLTVRVVADGSAPCGPAACGGGGIGGVAAWELMP